jgi:Fic family protein
MSSDDRHSEALEPELISDPDKKARREVRNGFQQFDHAIELIEYWLQPDRKPFKLRPSAIMSLNRLALDGLSRYAGVYRPTAIEIKGSKHNPPGAYLVAELIEELCEYIAVNWDRSPIHLASYILWRLNWIHAFVDGNGRTTRVTSFIVLCVRLGYRVPGSPTIPELISRDKNPYYSALEVADAAYESEKRIDVSAMEELVKRLLAEQLASVIHDARTDGHRTGPPATDLLR